jgi:hypothetical protein
VNRDCVYSARVLVKWNSERERILFEGLGYCSGVDHQFAIIKAIRRIAADKAGAMSFKA